MKPHYLTITSGAAQSFSARHDIKPDVNNHWHYHEELELIYIKKGSGTQFIGDSIRNFPEETIALIGSNLPHYWQFDDRYFSNVSEAVEVFVIHFRKDFAGKDFFGLPENTDLAKVIEFSKQGICLTEGNNSIIAQLIINAVSATGTRRMLYLLEALLEIAGCKEKELLVSLGFRADVQDVEKDRLQNIYNFSIKNYRRKIELKEVASLIQLTESAFCKFFRAKTGKTYTNFLNEIRVGHACRLLMDERYTIKEICFMCGFYNPASFHKCFKDIMGITPLKYQKQFV